MKDNTPIIMTEDYWANSPFSVVRYCGRISVLGHSYIIVDKHGKDIFRMSIEATRAGREKAIEPGEPCDLVRLEYVPIYAKVGRDKFIDMVERGLTLAEMKSEINKIKELCQSKEQKKSQTTLFNS